ncbi:hypothetical protein MAPG_02656 [Magnaporthiopsis poae ATCC 64411]|uniref:Uncharacterized protein n=1 Tax=Magnaporthiopsis poae (strain ATCC 64411 / 73-15) TaxID=644358 RepID=A0A0C4DRY8_MAGP6|nr:hypothetical protein MAPG_02656 [Magnaporthiopsis poae ATCC 64411]
MPGAAPGEEGLSAPAIYVTITPWGGFLLRLLSPGHSHAHTTSTRSKKTMDYMHGLILDCRVSAEWHPRVPARAAMQRISKHVINAKYQLSKQASRLSGQYSRKSRERYIKCPFLVPVEVMLFPRYLNSPSGSSGFCCVGSLHCHHRSLASATIVDARR